MVQIPGPGLKVGAKPLGLPGGGGGERGRWRLELTDTFNLDSSAIMSFTSRDSTATL